MKINCDYGESYGRYSLGENIEILKYVDMVNIACGFHAGDPINMQKSIEYALENHILVGAHPSYYDMRGFGRTPMNVPSEVLLADMLYQLSAIDGMLRVLGGKLHHVKPHGALYNQCAKDESIGKVVLDAIESFNKDLVVVGLSGSRFLQEAESRGLKTCHEVFADRQYHSDNRLVSRNLEGAVFHSVDQMIDQSVKFSKGSAITSRENTLLTLKADTLCIHGDGEHALEIAKRLREAL